MDLLLFEDDEGIAHLTKGFLEESGYQVEAFASARQGLERVRKKEFDIILLDQSLPDGKGTEIFEEIRRIRPQAICIMVTGTGNEEIAVRAMKSGMYDYIVKSVDSSHLKTLPHVIQKAFDLKRSREERERLQGEVEKRNRELEGVNLRLQRELKRLEESHRVAVDREITMIELKREINNLLIQMGRSEKYVLPPQTRS